MIELDDKDYMILRTLNKNSKLSTYMISKQTGIPVTTVHNRIKRLEEEKVIKSYTIDVDYEKIGMEVVVYLLTTYDMNEMERKGLKIEGLTKTLKSIPQIEDISYVTGRFDIILRVRLKNIKNLSSLVLEKIRKIPGIGHTETTYALLYSSKRRI
ncbi:MAG: Lrp/AsnC family transcriptional regulator [Nanoarchaeota archaeon]|nr:Lrp/AsnC family transcriptional regulator [Nanoarchaeota archaeon]